MSVYLCCECDNHRDNDEVIGTECLEHPYQLLCQACLEEGNAVEFGEQGHAINIESLPKVRVIYTFLGLQEFLKSPDAQTSRLPVLLTSRLVTELIDRKIMEAL